MSVERIAPKQRGRPFPKGHSGNPRGRPPGARNDEETTVTWYFSQMVVRAILDPDGA
jgi:hypothetical protein